MVLLIEGESPSICGAKAGRRQVDQRAVANALRADKGMRQRDIEGYVIF